MNARIGIDHLLSHKTPGLQAVDLFCWGIARKYNADDQDWYSEFEKKLIVDIVMSLGK